MKKLVVLTGAGISAESGLKTFRDSNGLWEGHDVTEVATPEGWSRNPELVLEFYNQRRKQGMNAKPNQAHIILRELEDYFDTTIITQNVDNLHEKAGSSEVIHLHGQLFESRSTADESLVYTMDHWELNLGDTCELGSQLRPNIVWFGEAVPLIETAAEICIEADVFLVVGTSMQVYPAAGLINYVESEVSKFIVDPSKPETTYLPNLHFVEEKATRGMELVKQKLLQEFI